MNRFNDILSSINNTLKNAKSGCDQNDSPLECAKEKLEDKLELKTLEKKLQQTKSEDSDFVEAKGIEEKNPEVEMLEYKKDFYDMSVGSITAIVEHAKNILSSLENPTVSENLTVAHLQGMIAVVEDQMRGIHDFVMYVSEAADTQSKESKPGLWENIRRKKEKEGKKYKPAKRGDKDRPDPDQWRKLTK